MSINEKKKVWVVGHKNPDTDSICAAIAYANLKNQTDGNRYEAKRARELNEETKYVLDTISWIDHRRWSTGKGYRDSKDPGCQRQNFSETCLGNDEGAECCNASGDG